jgi:hypothetical protein
MLDLFNTPTPQQSNYQEFYGAGSPYVYYTWNKPRGASMVRFLIIGAGGGGSGGSSSVGGGGGGSGAITSWVGPAIFIPDSLQIIVASGGAPNSLYAESSGVYAWINQAQYTLLYAEGGYGTVNTNTAGAGGGVMPANYFTASGIFTSIAGQAGAAGGTTGAGGNVAVSSTTFLSGGAGGAGAAASTGGRVSLNYDYVRLENTTAGGSVAGANGYFITQPILVGCGGAGGTTSGTSGSAGGRGGIGCGGGGAGEDAVAGGGRGGNGAVFIWAW